LIGNSVVREGLSAGYDIPSLIEPWRANEVAFQARRAPYLLYGEVS
jgi:uncharacterized protein YbbC (DUF1343 family)